MLDFAAIHRNKATLPLSIFTKVHKVRQPAFNATAIIIVGAATFIIKISLAFKAIHIKIPHYHSDIVKIFYKLAIGHNAHILLLKITIQFLSLAHQIINYPTTIYFRYIISAQIDKNCPSNILRSTIK